MEILIVPLLLIALGFGGGYVFGSSRQMRVTKEIQDGYRAILAGRQPPGP